MGNEKLKTGSSTLCFSGLKFDLISNGRSTCHMESIDGIGQKDDTKNYLGCHKVTAKLQIFQSGTLMIGGMSIFCGTIYYHALTEDKQYRKITPYGGVLLIVAWLSLLL